MDLKASDICKMIHGEIHGNPDITVSSFSSIKDGQKGDVTFLSDMSYKKYLESTNASLIITPLIDIKTNSTIIKVADPVKAFSKILDFFTKKGKKKHTISKNSQLHKSVKIGLNVLIDNFTTIQENAQIGDNCIILPNTFIGDNVKIGDSCTIGPNVCIYSSAQIGSNCIIHAGVIIGSDGFGFSQQNGVLSKMPQAGTVIIHDNVEIGANTTIDRGTLENTEIHHGVKLDNLIQIGHNVCIGSNTVIAAQCGIAGSTKIGNNCMIGGQVAIAHHLTIGDNVKIAGKSGVIKNVANNKIIQGPLAFNIKEFQKSYIHFKNLGHITNEIKNLKKQIAKNNKK